MRTPGTSYVVRDRLAVREVEPDGAEVQQVVGDFGVDVVVVVR
jgi:hypothetical protein